MLFVTRSPRGQAGQAKKPPAGQQEAPGPSRPSQEAPPASEVIVCFRVGDSLVWGFCLPMLCGLQGDGLVWGFCLPMLCGLHSHTVLSSVHISRVGACMYVYVRISTFLCMYVCRCICVYGGCYLELGILQDSKEKLDLSLSIHSAKDFCFSEPLAVLRVCLGRCSAKMAHSLACHSVMHVSID